MYPKHPGLHPSQTYGVSNPLIYPYIFIASEMKKAVSGSLRLASPARRREKGHRAEVDDGPWTKTLRVIVLLIGFGLGPGDRALHGRPTSTEGCFPGLHPYYTRACTRWRRTGCTPRWVLGILAAASREVRRFLF